jgi:cytochrome c
MPRRGFEPLILIKGKTAHSRYFFSPGARESTGARSVRLAAAVYFASVFGAGLVLGPIRVFWLEPRIGKLAAVPVTIVLCLSASSAAAQDAAAGQISFSRCLGCHSIGVDAKNKIGPQLNGLDGRKCGGVEGYAYSAANKDCAFTWNEANFIEYIRDPRAKIPGTRKSISGIGDQTEAKNLWAYLRQFNPDGHLK